MPKARSGPEVVKALENALARQHHVDPPPSFEGTISHFWGNDLGMARLHPDDQQLVAEKKASFLNGLQIASKLAPEEKRGKLKKLEQAASEKWTAETIQQMYKLCEDLAS